MTALSLGAASAVGLAQPAQAMNYTAATLSTWTVTDSATPTTPSVQPAGDVPLGTTVDAAGTRHTNRAYFTFDVSAYRGQAVHVAGLWTSEAKVADCATAAPIEVWRTGKVTAKSTWRTPPKDLELVDRRTLGNGSTCPAHLDVDVARYVTEALARKEKTITFGIRVSPAAESDPRAARTLQPARLSMSTNHVPTVRGPHLKNPDRPCGTLTEHPTAGDLTYFTATTTDADPNSYPGATFELWPVDRPDQRTRIGTGGGAEPVASTYLRSFADGTVLGWSVQPADHDDVGAWAKTCYLTVDNTAPAAAPLIVPRKYTETSYPGAGGPGVAGAFILDAQGDQDVVGFEYTEQGRSIPTRVKAGHPGGHAKISVTPQASGPFQLKVRSLDRAGNGSPWQTYTFYVRDTAPALEVDVTGVGTTSTITLTAPAAEVTSFGYTVDGGAETRVPAVAGVGTSHIVFTSKGVKTVVSRSYAGTKMIGSGSRTFTVDDAPKVTSPEFLSSPQPLLGTEGTFAFAPRTTGVVGYLYRFADETGSGAEQRVEAAADGTATLRWTAETPGYHGLTVVSVTADGTRSSADVEQFWVTDTRPYVYSEAGTCCPVLDAVGRPLTVWLSSDLPDVDHFVYSFDGGPEQTSDQGQSLSVTVTPTHVGNSSFTARAVRADGTKSPATTIDIYITNAPLVTTKGPYADYAVLGRESTLTFKPETPDVVGYRYYWGFEPETARTVDAAANGSATVTWTPTEEGTDILNVRAVSRDGTESDLRQIYVETYDPVVDYTGTWTAGTPSGGIGVAGQLGFFADRGGMLDATVKYLWHVDGGPVQETTRIEDTLVTYTPYTPERSGANTLYVQRQFTDGVLSPVRQFQLMVGTEPAVRSAEYPKGLWSGGAGVPGTFHFSGGTAGIVSYDYRFGDNVTGTLVTGTVAADATGAADVVFTPPQNYTWYTVNVTGRRADGTTTATSISYSFGTAAG
ncbi:hypothetical protein [Paractinoplanes ferrugineus]|uniref:hypothetical protein n=1 Tax=Paractinoplanes ferrugineus TaxID=113564 RepID=UPI001944AE27|nr:hypothetical protein [Actinoplanes ferrugineus]